MPTLTVDARAADVPEGQRLVLAIEAQGIAIGHRCGGFARCTTCRVEVLEGGRLLATTGNDGLVRLWDVASGRQLVARSHGGSFRVVDAVLQDARTP